MKIFVFFLVALFFLSSFFSSKRGLDHFQNEWVQYLGKDSIKYIYKFRDTLGCKILQQIVVEEKNTGNGGNKKFTNQITFDSSGKIKRISVTRSVNISLVENSKTNSYNYSYDQDVILFKEDSLKSFKFSNSSDQIISAFKIGSLMFVEDGKLYRPIYDFKDPENKIQSRFIGRGINPNLSEKEFIKESIQGLYKRKTSKKITKSKNKTANTIQVDE